MGRGQHDAEGGAEGEEQAEDEAGPVDDHGGELPLVLDVVLFLVPAEPGGDLADLLQDAHDVVAHGHAAGRVVLLHLTQDETGPKREKGDDYDDDDNDNDNGDDNYEEEEKEAEEPNPGTRSPEICRGQNTGRANTTPPHTYKHPTDEADTAQSNTKVQILQAQGCPRRHLVRL